MRASSQPRPPQRQPDHPLPPDASVLSAVEIMDSKLKALTSRLAAKNLKVEEQELEIVRLRRKLATAQITSAMMPGNQPEWNPDGHGENTFTTDKIGILGNEFL